MVSSDSASRRGDWSHQYLGETIHDQLIHDRTLFRFGRIQNRYKMDCLKLLYQLSSLEHHVLIFMINVVNIGIEGRKMRLS